MLVQKGLLYLINSFQQESFRLYQILLNLNNSTVSIIDQSNLNEQILTNFEYRFELPGIPVVASDVYPIWKQVRFPLDASTNIIGSGQRITRIDINAKAAPVGADFIIDLLVTKDKGVSWNSIFGPDISQKLILPIGLQWIKYGGKFILSNDILQDGWWFRVDVLQSDGTVDSPEIVVRGTLDISS